MIFLPKWILLGILIIVLLELGDTKSDEEINSLFEINSPPSHTALSGDLTIFLSKKRSENSEREQSFLLRILYLLDNISELIGEIPLKNLPNGKENKTVIVPCGLFTRGGVYVLKIQYKNSTVPEVETSKVLDVKWPTPRIYLESENFHTYPKKPVSITIKYEEVFCGSAENLPVAIYIFQLIYCGSSVTACYPQNDTHAQVLYYEELKGFFTRKIIQLRCELFGLPGNYAIRLKASHSNPTAPNISVYIKLSWSQDYRLSTRTRSIYPCDVAAGISLLFEYPSCRLENSEDKIRLYGRLRADVTSLASPSTLHYIGESRITSGRHLINFDCEMFTEKFQEYCFVYVSQSIQGAVAEARKVCVPTFPFQEGEVAGWGPWSPWSPCSTSCFGGIRNRYRFCDTPPPKYGAKFCQGKAVETEFCGFAEENLTEMRCLIAASKPEVAAEIGVNCRCGCVINIEEKQRKILGANTYACPGRSFWLLQAKSNHVIKLHLDQIQLPCPGQYFRARDGDSLSGNLLLDAGFDRMFRENVIITTGQSLLVELFTDELVGVGCGGGFVAHAVVLDENYLKMNRNITVVPFEMNSRKEKHWFLSRPAHLATASILILIFLVSIFLTLQFVLKYRKYRIAEDLDNVSDTSELVPGRSKSLSASTIISEVVSMIETAKETFHDKENQYNSTETLTGLRDESSLSCSTVKLNNTAESGSEITVTSNTEKLLPASSILTFHQPQVKYAYPVKLRTLDSESPEEKSSKTDDGKLESSMGDILKIYQHRSNYSEGKLSCPGSLISSPTQKSLKETKELRNREKLLQGIGSEFSLTNPDSELELDYYDYNVANASAVPGSYLGMDPAFLVWIPPIDSKLDEDEFFGNKRNSILTLETEGAALTPSEYRRLKLSEDFGLDLERTDSYLKKERGIEIGGEKLLPVRRIIEDNVNKDTSVKVSIESLPHCVIPNRRILASAKEEQDKKEEEVVDNSKYISKIFQDEIDNKKKESKEESVNIPMIELSGSPSNNLFARKIDNKSIDSSMNIQSPDYGIETNYAKACFFDQNIRFVDDDDDDGEFD